MKQTIEETKAVDAELLKTRASGIAPVYHAGGKTVEEWEQVREQEHVVLQEVLAQHPGLSIEAFSIALRLENAGMSREDAIAQAMESCSPNDF